MLSALAALLLSAAARAQGAPCALGGASAVSTLRMQTLAPRADLLLSWWPGASLAALATLAAAPSRRGLGALQLLALLGGLRGCDGLATSSPLATNTPASLINLYTEPERALFYNQVSSGGSTLSGAMGAAVSNAGGFAQTFGNTGTSNENRCTTAPCNMVAFGFKTPSWSGSYAITAVTMSYNRPTSGGTGSVVNLQVYAADSSGRPIGTTPLFSRNGLSTQNFNSQCQSSNWNTWTLLTGLTLPANGYYALVCTRGALLGALARAIFVP